VRKRKAIVTAATTLFLRSGYQGTSMDQVAALAGVSKQTVYKQFADKERLFGEVVSGISGRVDAFIADATATLNATVDLPGDLRDLARRYVVAVMQPEVLQLRRLMISEANRFPDLGRAYYERGPERVVAALARAFHDLTNRGLLSAADPLLAARHFAFLVLSIPMDRALVCGDAAQFSRSELESLADSGVAVFLAAHGVARQSRL
jgi:TetR/AcrR family transcriptional repressor of mexJK operon